jgi:hypothetical protein
LKNALIKLKFYCFNEKSIRCAKKNQNSSFHTIKICQHQDMKDKCVQFLCISLNLHNSWTPPMLNHVEHNSHIYEIALPYVVYCAALAQMLWNCNSP